MRKIILVLVVLSSLFSSFVSARDFDERLYLQVLNYDGKTLSMKVTEANADFPKSTVFYSKVTEHKPHRRFLRSEYIKANITEAVLPNGTSKELGRRMKVRTRRLSSKRSIGNRIIATTGTVLGITIDFLTVGLPVGRGGLALWNAGYHIHEKEEGESTFKEGVKGFFTGALYPIPQLVRKSKQLDLRAGSELVLLPADDDDQVKIVANAL